MARTRYKIVDNHSPYFLTATVVNWIPLLSTPIVQQMLLDSLCFLQEQERLVLYAFVILENHLHLIASSANLSKEMGDFKSYTARQIIDYYESVQAQNILKQLAFHKKLYKQDRDYQLWQEGSHPQRIQGLAMLRQKVAYIVTIQLRQAEKRANLQTHQRVHQVQSGDACGQWQCKSEGGKSRRLQLVCEKSQRLFV